MTVILSSRNPTKIHQIRQLFEGSPINILGMDDAGIEGEAIEDGETLRENALKKAQFAKGYVANAWTMADDTGIFIAALDGRPGVRSGRWAGESATTEEGMQFALAKMKGISDRSATFRTVVTLISPDGEEYFFTGEVQGILIDIPRVPPQPKMPYSPLFIPHGEEKTWAEMSTEYENNISHRGKAFRQARVFLEDLLEKK